MSRRADEELVQDALDGRLGPGGFEAFQQRLGKEPGLRQTYYDYSRLHHLLCEEHEGESLLAGGIPTLRSLAGPRPRLGPAVLAAAAILMLLATGLFLIVARAPEAGVAVRFGPEAFGRVAEAGGLAAGSSRLEPGSHLVLERGAVELTMDSGVRGLLEGPARLEVLSGNALRLTRGRAWFRVPGEAAGFTCQTTTLTVVDLGTEFGVLAGPGVMEEVHVLAGRVEVRPLDGSAAARELAAGEAVAWNGRAFTQPVAGEAFVTSLPRVVPVFDDDFSEPDETPLDGKHPDAGGGPWEVRLGAPAIYGQVLDTSGAATMAFAPLGVPRLSGTDNVLLLTITTEEPDARTFDTAGWAGVSLYTGEEERVFVGEPGGEHGAPGTGWAIHRQGGLPVAPSPPLQGKATVTLRYDFRTGLAQLFEGVHSKGVAIAAEQLPPGLVFDRIRLANGEGGDIAIRHLRVTVLATGH